MAVSLVQLRLIFLLGGSCDFMSNSVARVAYGS